MLCAMLPLPRATLSLPLSVACVSELMRFFPQEMLQLSGDVASPRFPDAPSGMMNLLCFVFHCFDTADIPSIMRPTYSIRTKKIVTPGQN
jgi:hypothetical protein